MKSDDQKYSIRYSIRKDIVLEKNKLECHLWNFENTPF